MRRLLRHLFAPSVEGLFPPASLDRIAAAIARGEASHRGEVCFAVEAALPPGAVLRGCSARERAEAVFARLRVWDTEANNGVLLYLLLAEHRIEIVADRGFRGRVDDAGWREVCARMEARLHGGGDSADAMEAAVLDALDAMSTLVAAHFSRVAGEPDDDELSNRPHLL